MIDHYFADLTPYSDPGHGAAGVDPPADGVEEFNIGWLGQGHGFPTSDGEPDPEFLANLITLAADHRSHVIRGYYRCELPHSAEDEARYAPGDLICDAEICVVAADGRWLAAPAVVVHYVRDHAYRPPAEFVEAVKAMRVAPGRL